MAAIGTIRKYSGIAVGFIGVSILAFVITDGLGTGSSLFGGGSDVIVGEMGGHEITYQDFDSRYKQELEVLKALSQQAFVDDETKGRLRQEVWSLFQQDYIYEKEYENAGIKLSDEELLFLMAGPEPHPQVKQMFTDPETQSFSRNALLSFLDNFEDAREIERQYWLYIERMVYLEEAFKKYNNLLSGSFYVTDLEAKDKFYSKNKMATFEYVSLPVRDVADSIVENLITESDIQEKYEKIKTQHEVEKSRIAEYVKFEIVPTTEDTSRVYDRLDKIIKDSNKVKSNIGWYSDTMHHNPGYYESYIDEVYFADNDDSVIGPYLATDRYKIAKLISKEEDTIYYYKARHILIKPKGNTDQDTLEAMNKAREILKRVQDGESFEKIVLEESDNSPGTKSKGGDLGWFKKGDMVQPFYDGVRNLKKGERTVVKSQFGAHVIEATADKNNLRIKVGFIEEPVIASDATRQKAFDLANSFRIEVEDYESFIDYTNEQQIEVNETREILVTQDDVPGLEKTSEFINWLFDDQTKLYDISDIIDAKNAYLVAVITDVTEKGYAPVEKLLESVIKPELLMDKKREYQANKMKEAIEGKSDLKSIADAVGSTVVKVPTVSLDAPYLPNAGQEQKLVGSVVSAQPDRLYGPLVGENGVYMYQLISFNEVEEPADLIQEKSELLNNLESYAKMKSRDLLIEKADIEDNRYKFSFN